jgi:hypothetical protein
MNSTGSHVQTRASAKVSDAASNDNNCSVTLATFSVFQNQIYPIIEQIVTKPELTNHPFVTKWLAMTTSGTIKVQATSTFRVISKALGINSSDLHAYRRYLETCPTIHDHVTFMDSTNNSTGFMCHIHKKHEDVASDITTANSTELKNPEQAGGIENSEAPTTPTTPTQDNPYEACYGTPTEFHNMLQTFWPTIQNFIVCNSSHDHAKQWKAWIANGLTDKTDISTFKQLVGVDTLDKLYIFFRDSPAVNPFLR